jgi:hypothetical protein
MDTVGIRVPTKQIRELYTFSTSSALKRRPSVRCTSAANDISGKYLEKALSPLRTLSLVQIDYFSCFVLLFLFNVFLLLLYIYISVRLL